VNELVGGQGSSGPVGEAGIDRCSKLSSGQLEVLRLVNNHLNSKEIAGALGISSHTVDQRVRGAIRTLGVTRRSEAARLVAAYDRALGIITPSDAAYQRLIHQAPDIDPDPVRPQIDGAVSFQIRHADRTGGVGAERLETEQRSTHRPLLLLPWSTPHHPRNGWSVGQRLAAIVSVAIAASFSAGMLLAGLESLARLVSP
jgi:DNA-binding CsgD family transcriptional regulator